MSRKWNKFYKDNGRFYLLSHPELPKTIKIFKKLNVLHVLDLGCGSGRHLVKLAREGFDVVGLDYSVIAAKLAEEHLNKEDLPGKVYTGDYRYDLENFKEKSFDAVVSVSSLHYIASESELAKIFGSISQILKKNGVLFLVLPSKETLIIEPEKPQIFFEKAKLNQNLERYFEIKEFYQDSEKSWVIYAINK